MHGIILRRGFFGAIKEFYCWNSRVKESATMPHTFTDTWRKIFAPVNHWWWRTDYARRLWCSTWECWNSHLDFAKPTSINFANFFFMFNFTFCPFFYNYNLARGFSIEEAKINVWRLLFLGRVKKSLTEMFCRKKDFKKPLLMKWH